VTEDVQASGGVHAAQWTALTGFRYADTPLVVIRSNWTTMDATFLMHVSNWDFPL
jgi:hypothetical protein